MRHRKAGRKLGRNSTHRLALYRNLTMALKRHEVRLGDAGATAYLELLKAGEVRARAKQAYSAPAPVPKVEEQPEEPAAPPTEQPAPAPETASQAPAGEEAKPTNPPPA